MTDRKEDIADLTPWQKFDGAMRQIVKVPYRDIKDKLEAEEKIRSRKRTRSGKIRAFREANRDDKPTK